MSVEQRLAKGLWWLVVLSCLLYSVKCQADSCLRLMGVVQDYTTKRPLQAKLFIKLTTGRLTVGQSAAGSGQFVIDLDCRATALIIEQVGYQTQQLALPPLSSRLSTKALGIVIPLVAIDNQGVNQVYQQAAQTHYEQQATQATGQTQRGIFIVTDALTNQPLFAKACLFPTNGQPKRCFDTDKLGQFKASFTQQDIVAIEIQATGYLPYQGNIAIEQLDGQQRRHAIRLLRELAMATIQVTSSWKGVRCTMQADAGTTVVALPEVPGVADQYCTYTLQSGKYQLIVQDVTGNTRHRQAVYIQTGVNVVEVTQPGTTPKTTSRPVASIAPPASALVPVTSLRAYQLPDELPVVYFDQGSYQLDDDDRELLQQVSLFMRAHPEYRLKLIGHTDPEGNEQMNRYLSEFRAKMIANYLFWQGIPDNRITISGQGSRYPVAAGDVEANKAKNRRVFLKLEVINE